MIHQKFRCVFNIAKQESKDADVMKEIRRQSDEIARKDAVGYLFYSLTETLHEDDFLKNRVSIVVEYRDYI